PMLEARDLASLLWLPLLDRAGEQLGTIVLAWKRDPKLSAQALEASESFASLGARAISGAERVRAQTEVLEQGQALLLTTPRAEVPERVPSPGPRAISGSERVRAQPEVLEQVQALLLTTPPAEIAGFRIGVRYQSASGLAQIGGDLYDVVELDERGLAFILADARGKGLEASSLAAVLKGAFRSLAGEGAGPARILNRLDRLVAREGGDEDFVTALAGRLHPDGRILLASAGHPAPLGAGPRLVQVAAPLGLGTQANESQAHLRPGDRLVCYTDGLVEARDAAGEFLDPAVFEAAVGAESLTAPLDRPGRLGG